MSVVCNIPASSQDTRVCSCFCLCFSLNETHVIRRRCTCILANLAFSHACTRRTHTHACNGARERERQRERAHEHSERVHSPLEYKLSFGLSLCTFCDLSERRIVEVMTVRRFCRTHNCYDSVSCDCKGISVEFKREWRHSRAQSCSPFVCVCV